MGFDSILNAVVSNGGGLVGILLVVMLWFNYKLVTKLFKVIEINTKVMSNSTATQEAGIEVIKKNSEIIADTYVDEQRHRDQCERTHNEIHSIGIMVKDASQTLDFIYERMKKE